MGTSKLNFESMLHKVLNKLFKRRDIVVNGDLYLRRWYLTPLHWKTRVFLHCIVKPDDDQHLHDHPWDFTTVILARGYDEATPDQFMGHPIRELKMHYPREVLKRTAEHTHAVNPWRGPAWTLVFASQARRVWGFHTEDGWMDWRTYLQMPDAPDHPEDIIPKG